MYFDCFVWAERLLIKKYFNGVIHMTDRKTFADSNNWLIRKISDEFLALMHKY